LNSHAYRSIPGTAVVEIRQLTITLANLELRAAGPEAE
jgi:hypothetical protein